MADDTVLKIALAGLMHDIGKFAEPAGLALPYDDYSDRHCDLYCPFRDNHHSHKHSIYTAAFVESKEIQPYLPRELNDKNWGDESEPFINLAAGHHKPDSALKWIVASADRIGSGWDRVKFEAEYNYYVRPKNYAQTRLLPLLELVSTDDFHTTNDGRAANSAPAPEDWKHYLELKSLSSDSIFPVRKDARKIDSNEEAKEEYQSLFKEFIESVKNLKHNDNIALWAEHFDSLYMAYVSNIPAARAADIIPDISLYDHSRVTASLASALYLYHKHNNTLIEASIKEDETEKLLLIYGNFSGIQKFIFNSHGESGKYRSKLLRGRSFAVSLYTELAADMLCREIGLSFLSVVLNAAGNFLIIAPNTPEAEESVERVKGDITKWLFKYTYGETLFNVTTLKSAPIDFRHDKFRDLYQKLMSKSEKIKASPFCPASYCGAVNDYLGAIGASGVCNICGRRPASVDANNRLPEACNVCELCADHIRLGEWSVKNVNLGIVNVGTIDNKLSRDALLTPIFGRYGVCVDELCKKADRDKNLLRYWKLQSVPNPSQCDATVCYINGYIPSYKENDEYDFRFDVSAEESRESGTPKTFNDLASLSLEVTDEDDKPVGLKALGVLRADIDHLGAIFAHGLSGSRYTLSRIATLSRQINQFFTLYLPTLLSTDDRFKNIYTVFAGGDDLFLIGPWNAIVELKAELNSAFSRYVCGNVSVHVSVGISIHPAHTPVGQLSDMSEAALKKSKQRRNEFTLFGRTVAWSKLEQLLTIKRRISEMLRNNDLSVSVFYRLNKFIDMAEEEARVTSSSQKSVCISDMDCLRWRPMIAYQIERNALTDIKRKDTEEQQRKEMIKSLRMEIVKWIEEHRGDLRIPLWQVLYSRRRR